MAGRSASALLSLQQWSIAPVQECLRSHSPRLSSVQHARCLIKPLRHRKEGRSPPVQHPPLEERAREPVPLEVVQKKRNEDLTGDAARMVGRLVDEFPTGNRFALCNQVAELADEYFHLPVSKQLYSQPMMAVHTLYDQATGEELPASALYIDPADPPVQPALHPVVIKDPPKHEMRVELLQRWSEGSVLQNEEL